MKALLLAGGMLAAAAAAAVVAAPAVSIELRPEVRVGAGAVTLGDVARLESTDLGLMRQLVDLPVGRSPLPGHSVVLERAGVAAWVRRQLGLPPERIEWRGPSAARITAGSQLLRGEAIVAAAREALPAAGDLQAVPRDLELPDGQLRLQPRPFGPLRQRTTVWVDVRVDERLMRSVPVAFQVESARTLVDEPVAPKPEAPVLTRGQWAEMQSVAGVVQLQARVEVLQDGRLGEVIRVRQPGAQAPVQARVTGPGQLEIVR